MDVELQLKPDKQQRTLFSLAKVVRLDAKSSVCFTHDDINQLKQSLLDVTQTKHQLLITLRKLDCYKLQLRDLESTGISNAVATLAAKSPKPDVHKLAANLLTKWRALAEETLFQPIATYDATAAAEAEDGEPEAPEDVINAIKEKKRQEKLEARRKRYEEEGILESSSDEEGNEENEDQIEDPDWAPQKGTKLSLSRRSRRSQQGGSPKDGEGSKQQQQQQQLEEDVPKAMEEDVVNVVEEAEVPAQITEDPIVIIA